MFTEAPFEQTDVLVLVPGLAAFCTVTVTVAVASVQGDWPATR
jgi:hypothetical protein